MTEDALNSEQAEPPTDSIATASPLTAEQQLVVDAVSATIRSEEFAAWQSLYKDWMGNDPKTPEVTSVIHYQIGSFEGEKMDCYLINVSADVADPYQDNYSTHRKTAQLIHHNMKRKPAR